MFDRLIALSQDKSSEGRRDLLKSISELFTAGAETYSDTETQLFGDVLCRLVDQVSVDARAQLSAQIAPLASTPRATAFRLATDEAPAVSAVMLEQSAALTDSDLCAIAGLQSQRHLLAIAKRASLGEMVTEVLAARGNAEVLEEMTNNASARFSDLGLRHLASRGLDHPKVLIALSRRPDVPPERLARAMAALDAEGRAKLEDLAAVSPELAAVLRAEATELARWQKQKLEGEIAVLIGRLKQGLGTVDDAIGRFADERRIEAIVELLTQASNLEETHIINVLYQTRDFGLAVVCRSIGIGDRAYLKLSLLRAVHLHVSPSNAYEWADAYAEIDQDSADRALRFRRIRLAIQKCVQKA